MSRIEDHKYNISEAFRECYYIIPDYQREYVWTEKEVYRLLEDINDEIDDSMVEYFIGTILVSPTDKPNHYEVIDGQQRLTTFFLILCVLKHFFAEEEQQQKAISGLISDCYTNLQGEVEQELRLEPRYEHSGALVRKIVEIGSDPNITRQRVLTEGIPTFGSLENILNAYDVIYRYINENYQMKNSLKKYWGFLANRVVFIQISTDVSSALKIFETINERGIGLNPMDLLKNLLFTQVSKDEFTILKNKWKGITEPLEKNHEKPLRFLRYYLMANYQIDNKRKDGIIREDEIYDWFIVKTNADLCDYKNKPFDFVQQITGNVNRFIDYSLGRGNEGQESISMKNLKALCGGGFSLHYILLLSASNLPKSLFDHFVAQLESFLFYYIFTKTPTKELERNFSQWADELRSIGKIVDPLKQIQEYNQFLEDKFHKSIMSKEAELNDHLNRYTLNSMQQYRTRYLLAKLTQYVDMAFKGEKTPRTLDEYIVLEIEHILPNNPATSLRDAFINNNPGADYEDYKTRLGNLTLLEKPLNIVASNNAFDKKLIEYQKSQQYLTSSIASLTIVGNNTSINRMNQNLRSFDIWNAASIEERQGMLIRMVKEVWRINGF